MNRHKVLIVLLMLFLIGTAAQAQDTPQAPQQAQPQGRGGGGAGAAPQDLLNLIGVLQQANTTAAQRGGAGGRGARAGAGTNNPDLVNEIRVITAPVDATTTTVTGRGLLTSPNSGAWWTNAGLLARLGMTDDQKLKIERVFESNRLNLTTSRENLEKEELQLSKLLDAETLDRGSVTSQIYKVVQARGEMEKINALMTLEMREVLTRAQWTQLQVQQSVNVTATGGGIGPAGGQGGLGRGQRSGGPLAPGTAAPAPGGAGGRGVRGQ